jgi:hypothetical protein
MMRTTSLALLAALAGCPEHNGNPSVLWLAPDQNETHVKLTNAEPKPY